MKKLFAAIGLATCAAANASDWVKVMESDLSSVYLDRSSIRSNSSFKSAWSLYDLKRASTVEGKAFLSMKDLNTFSCSDRTYVTKSMLFYSGQKANGEMVSSSDNPTPLRNVAPDTLSESLLQAVCNQD